MIQLTQGLVNSLVILELLRNDERLKKLTIYVNCFQNCREMGLTFGIGLMTYCIYEHRNSDQIIINGKKNWCGHSGDLPYSGEDKWSNIASFSPGKYDECAEYLIDLLLNYKEDNERSNIT